MERNLLKAEQTRKTSIANQKVLYLFQAKFRVQMIDCMCSVYQNALHVCHCCLVAESCLTLWRLHGLQPTRLLCPQDFPDENTRVGCHFLFKGIFPTQRLNPHLQGSLAGRVFTTEPPGQPSAYLQYNDTLFIYLCINSVFITL